VREAELAAATYTVDRLIDDWASLHLVERAKSYGARTPKQMRKGLADWLKTPAINLKRQHAVQVLDWTKKNGGPIATNRLHAVARACWTWAMKRGALTENPWTAIPRPSRENARERVLSDDELAILWCAADELESRGGRSSSC
jgi:site-specific recombinase XerD